MTVRIVPEAEWTHGEAKGICEQLSLVDIQPLVKVRDRANAADLARTLIHEYAHALLHFDVDDESCTCPDWQQHSPEGGCKHLRRVDHEIKRGRVPRPNGRLSSP